jgi:hypothetical protein
MKMKFFDRFNKRSNAAMLVKQGLANEESVTIQQIRDCIFLLANATGETWKTASKEAAAGKALIVLAKNAELKNCLNRKGWKLVVSFITTNPEIARDISPRTMGQIFSYQQSSIVTMSAA